MARAMLSKSLIQFSVDGQGSVTSLLFGLRPNYGGGDEDNGDLLQEVSHVPCRTQCPQPCSSPPPTHGSARDSWTLTASLSQSPVGSLLLSPGFWCTHGFVLPSKSLLSWSCGSSVIKSHLPPKSGSLRVLSPFGRSPGWELCFGP